MMAFIYGVCCFVIAYGANHFIINMMILKSKKLRSAIKSGEFRSSHIIILRVLIYLLILVFVLIVGDIPGVIILSAMALYHYYIKIKIVRLSKIK